MTQPSRNVHEEYIRRVNNVIDHIYAHVAEPEELSLDRLAEVACFSPFHFHRIFKAVTGERVNHWVRRARLERAAALMRSAPEMLLADIAAAVGFSSLSDFSRTFKKAFDISPGRWDRRTPLQKSKMWQPEECAPLYLASETTPEPIAGEFSVALQLLAGMHLGYVRIARPYQPGALAGGYTELHRRLAPFDGSLRDRMLIGMSMDNPDVTPPEQVSYDFCVTLQEDEAERWRKDGGNVRLLPGCRIAAVQCNGTLDKVARAWEYLCNIWLPGSNYLPADLPPMEIYRTTPDELGWERFDIDCAVPVEQLLL